MFPHKVGLKWEIWTPAKLNLYLEVLGRQESGYHELETLMTHVRLYDHLQWSPISDADNPTGLEFRLLHSGHCASDSLRFGNHQRKATALVRRQFGSVPSCMGRSGMGRSTEMRSTLHDQNELATKKLATKGEEASEEETNAEGILGENNLVLRAARLLACHAGTEPYGTLTLRKRIPISAGMGGGSSDAAATLVLANKAWGINYPVSMLIELASELGSDVPFFLTPGMAICRGRGEQIEPVRSLGRLHFVVVKPPMGFSTTEVFAQMARNSIPEGRVQESRKRLTKLVGALRKGVLSESVSWMTNRLEEVATSMSDWFGLIRKAMSESGCCGRWMTGSGSAYVGLVRTAGQAYHVGGLLASRRLGTVFVTSSIL